MFLLEFVCLLVCLSGIFISSRISQNDVNNFLEKFAERQLVRVWDDRSKLFTTLFNITKWNCLNITNITNS